MDLSWYDPLDWICRVRLEMAMHTADEELRLLVWQQMQTRNLAIATMPIDPTTAEMRNKYLKLADQAKQQIFEICLPWLVTKEEAEKALTTPESIYQGMYQQWVKVYGDPKDPAVAARIQQTADWLHRTSGVRSR